jgi:hypothetical protein
VIEAGAHSPLPSDIIPRRLVSDYLYGLSTGPDFSSLDAIAIFIQAERSEESWGQPSDYGRDMKAYFLAAQKALEAALGIDARKLFRLPADAVGSRDEFDRVLAIQSLLEVAEGARRYHRIFEGVLVGDPFRRDALPAPGFEKFHEAVAFYDQSRMDMAEGIARIHLAICELLEWDADARVGWDDLHHRGGWPDPAPLAEKWAG